MLIFIVVILFLFSCSISNLQSKRKKIINSFIENHSRFLKLKVLNLISASPPRWSFLSKTGYYCHNFIHKKSHHDIICLLSSLLFQANFFPSPLLPSFSDITSYPWTLYPPRPPPFPCLCREVRGWGVGGGGVIFIILCLQSR